MLQRATSLHVVGGNDHGKYFFVMEWFVTSPLLHFFGIGGNKNAVDRVAVSKEIKMTPALQLERPGETIKAAEVFSINKHTKTTAGDKRLLPHRLFPPGMDLYSCAWVPPHCLRFMGTSRWSPPWCPLAAHSFFSVAFSE